MKLSTSLLLLIISVGVIGCSDKTPKTNIENMQENVEEAVDDVEQQACETMNGDAECAVERAQEDMEEAAEDLTN